MGFIKAAFGSAGGQLADQWKEFYVCDALSADVLVAKGQKKETKRSSNKKGEENVITHGSVVTVADGQCVLCVEQGAIVDVVAEPGEFEWDTNAQPSLFASEDLKTGIKDSFAEMGKRFGFGGQPGVDQRIYYVNTKELVGNKYGTTSPIPFRVVDNRVGLDLDITVRCNGEYSYRIVDPIVFYKNIAGNAEDEYRRGSLDSQLRTELLTALQPALARLSAQGVRYSEIPMHTAELCDFLNEELSEKWTSLRGLKIVSFGMNSITTSEENERMIVDFQRAAAMRDPNMAAAQIAAATADAMRAAAENESGAMNGFMGMGMTGVAGGMGANGVSQLFSQGAQSASQAAPQGYPQGCYEPVGQSGRVVNAEAHVSPAVAMAAAGSVCATPIGQNGIVPEPWRCSCGNQNTGNFCSMCGSPKPRGNWTCECGVLNDGNYCINCGKPRP